MGAYGREGNGNPFGATPCGAFGATMHPPPKVGLSGKGVNATKFRHSERRRLV